MPPLLKPVAKGDARALAGHVLLQDHASGARRNRRTRKDARGLAGADRPAKSPARRGFADDLKDTARQMVLLADRVAIHRRSGKGRLGQPRDDRRGQNAARRLA